MFATVIFLIALLWLVLAVAVGSHARGHNRSGIVWFGIVLVTGIFGLAFYLLSITSASSKNGESEIGGRSLDQKIVTKGPKYAICAVFGGVSVFLVGYIWAEMASMMTRPPLSQEGIPISPLESLVSPIMFFSLLTGAVAGPLAVHKRGFRRFVYYLTYVPAVVAGMLGTLYAVTEVTGLGPGDFYGGPLILVPPVVELLGAIAGIVVWKRAYDTVIRPAVQSVYSQE